MGDELAPDRTFELKIREIWQKALDRARHEGSVEEPDFTRHNFTTLHESVELLDLHNQATGQQETNFFPDAIVRVQRALEEELRCFNLKVTADNSWLGTNLRLVPA